MAAASLGKAAEYCTELAESLWSELNLCLTGSVEGQHVDVHFSAHDLVLGEMAGVAGPHDPLFYLHHAWLDMMRVGWQAANPDKRPYAFGYPATGYLDGLNTPLGYRKFNLGFDKKRVSDQEGWVTPTDVLCGMDELYTYDTLLDDPLSWVMPARGSWSDDSTGSNPSLRPALLPPWWLPAFVVAAVVALLIKRACGRSCRLRLLGFKGHSADDEPALGKQGYDMGINDAALPRAAELPLHA